MKSILYLLAILVLSSCSSARFVDSWKNQEITEFQPKKLLVIGITENLTARKIFEDELKLAFMQRNINTEVSSKVLNKTFTETKKSEVEIDEMVGKLSKEGFDAVAITAVRGVEEQTNYSPGYYTVNYRWTRFGRYYYRYQDVYYTPNYYNDYKVYNVETSIYNINQDDSKSLVWVGSFDISNPQTITTSVTDYVERVINQLEKEKVIRKK